ncbi:hypothetical protein JW711_03410, partial [Candidatus Woesearchaeota archaeon]|nr:hypothetical protein [Candidatus Woesearchaeota archaeon]
MDKGLSLEKVIEILDNTSDSRSRSAYDLAKDAVEGMPLDQYNHLYRHMRDLLDRAQDDLSQSF